ncbi:MAG: hypothetical protein C0592_03120 [Marinilabiliales bacterium]|nr:MAG: hypothetical protein C0592_03120 [Marinilabiliales bacterium]
MRKTSLNFNRVLILSCVLVLLGFGAHSQMTVTVSTDQTALVNQFLGSGITLTGTPTKYCHSNGTGYFYDGFQTTCPMDSGIILCTGYASFLNRDVTFTASASLNFGSYDAQLATLSVYSITDICYITFSFIPDYDTLHFQYVFGSEEYLEWVGSVFNDVFGFFISGPNPAGGSYSNQNLALVPTTASIVSINSINTTSNSAYYINNYNTGTDPGLNDPYFTCDGYTVLMDIGVSVVAGQTYTIKMAIGDVSDPMWDSYVLLKSSSFSSTDDTGMPVELTDFNASRCHKDVCVNWETQTETNNDYFTIERSEDGIHWETAGIVDGAGNSNHARKYEFTDIMPYIGLSYYRLTQTDFDGKTTVFAPVMIKAADNTQRELIKIIDFMGRETEYRPNTPLIFIYSDGSRERVLNFEDQK